MNAYETAILRLQKRIKRIEENPEPTMLTTNKMMYELEIEGLQAANDAWRTGKPIAEGVPVYTLFRAMGFTPSWRTVLAMQTMEATQYFEVLRSMGLSTNTCDMASVPLAMSVRGDLPRESLIIATNGRCVPQMLGSTVEAQLLRSPTFTIDVGLEDNEDGLQYVTNQLGQFIEFAEWKVKGIKYDEDRLIELQEIDRAYYGYYGDTYEALKHVPCPIGGKDTFRNPRRPSQYPDPAKGVAYSRARRDEVCELAEKGVAAVPGEKLRMLWAVTGPYFMDPFKALAKHGVVVPFYYGGFPFWFAAPIPQPTYWGGRKLSPLEQEATKLIKMVWAGLGTRWVDGLIWLCRDLKIDAIINYCMMGCSATLGLKKLVEDTAERHLGIPTLQLQGRQLEVTYADKVAIEAKLEDFADMCLALKQG